MRQCTFLSIKLRISINKSLSIDESIFVYNLTTGKEANTGAQQGYEPAIYGDKVVWSDN
jgi:hypothetical protein